MTSKQISKVKDPEKKAVKKKGASSVKTKDTPVKKTVKKTTVSKKTVKAKSVSKKTELKSETKAVKTKTPKTDIKTRLVKKTIPKKKKPRIKNEAEKNIEKKDESQNAALKKESNKQEYAVVREQSDTAYPSLPSKSKDDEQKQKKEYVSPLSVSKQPEKKPKPIIKQHVETKEKSEAAPKTNEPKPTAAASADNYIGLIVINELTTVKELADKMKLRAGDVLKKLLLMGSLATINQRLDADVAILLANEFGYDAKFLQIYSEEKINNQKEDPSKFKTRPPIVTIMGHVDHGKTSLLDVIRSSNIAAGEHGGITQHIGAYKVKTPKKGGYVAFLDTPGHEAFTAMRSRGAQATDIVILVVSASDGVMPQTVEAINHAKTANVPIIVAINKIDLPSADPKKIRQELSNYGLIAEEWGGDIIMIDVSAKQKTNINSLLEMILLKAEMMELKSNPDKNAEGIVVEAKLDSRRGSVATLLVQSGTLKIGDSIVIGTTYGKVRAMSDEYGKKFYEAPPSTPVEILGINEPPQAGDKFIVVDHESHAREIAQSRKIKVKEASLKPRHHLSLVDISSGQKKDLRIILKTDVQGSLGALSDSLERLSISEISLKIIHRGAGAITESDVALAVASDALIVGFNLRPDTAVEKLANSKGVNINVYRIIYDLIADIKAAMEGLLEPAMKEKIVGKAVVKQIFKLSSYGTISGCSVIDGKIQRGARVRLLRDNVIIFEGNISSLKRFKDDVKEVEKGYECGIGLENFSDIKSGDIIENFTTEKVARKLSD
ncbi:MAG: translation initiation factor IF-2 [Endomicrobium sp.]|jgi:translation initiation factor IF-2|nr:translation initiation factor IF-2 [Endomicrobium sp.]